LTEVRIFMALISFPAYYTFLVQDLPAGCLRSLGNCGASARLAQSAEGADHP
jgi:hypothetical protein